CWRGSVHVERDRLRLGPGSPCGTAPAPCPATASVSAGAGWSAGPFSHAPRAAGPRAGGFEALKAPAEPADCLGTGPRGRFQGGRRMSTEIDGGQSDTSGEPSVEAAGLRLWVHGRLFPSAHDPDEGNLLRATIRCESDELAVKTDDAAIRASDLARWARDC